MPHNAKTRLRSTPTTTIRSLLYSISFRVVTTGKFIVDWKNYYNELNMAETLWRAYTSFRCTNLPLTNDAASIRQLMRRGDFFRKILDPNEREALEVRLLE